MLRDIGRWAMIALALATGGCGSGGGAPVGGLSAEEAAQLDNAAQMLDGAGPAAR